MNINGKTKLIGLLGWPVSHTKSPALHNTASVAYEQNLVYLPLPVHPDGVEAAVCGLPALGFLGVNVTVPHKQAVMPFLDHIDSAAEAIGAVNTIVFTPQEDGSFPPISTGYNTDWIGVRQDLAKNGVDFHQRDCLVLGAGGSARAVVYMLLAAEAKVRLLARRLEQAAQLRQDMLAHFPHASLAVHELAELETVCDQVAAPLILNCTPVGMHPKVEHSVWPEDLPFPAGSFVYDLIYTPSETKIMRQAAAAGCGTSNGFGMLLGQAAEAYRLWTGIDPDVALMAQAVEGA